MIIITGTIKVESESEFLSVRGALIARTERSLKDQGNIEYAFSQDLADPTLIHLMEKWEDEAALQAHLDIPDEEFSAVMTNVSMVSALVTSYEVAAEKVMMDR